MAKTQEKEIVKTETVGALADIPAWVKQGDTRGTDHIKPEDARVPRLKLAQGMSDQVKRGNAAFIPGLQLGQLFNDLSGEVYEDEEIEVVFIRADPPRHLIFDPSDRKVILERDVPPSDPRTQFTTGSDGKRVKPVASKFYDYVVVKLDTMEPLALSFSSTGIATAQKLNGMLKIKPAPIFVQKFKLGVASQKNDLGEWYVITVKPAGFVTQEQAQVTERMFEQFRTKNVEFDTESTDGGGAGGDGAADHDGDGKTPF